MAFLSYIIALFRFILEILSQLIFKLKYWKGSNSLPAIANPIVTESAVSLAKKIRSKEISSEEVIKAFIHRIEQVNPFLNAVIENNFTEALKEARAVDKLINSGTISEEELSNTKPFLGVPFTIKDSFAVNGFKLSCGLYSRKDVVADRDADVVTLMKYAGAIFLAMTNVPELCMWWESANTIYGRTNNPYDFNRSPGGSSGGEGSLLSASGSPMGVGSDIGGSIRMPSFFNGIFGHKPSPTVVSLEGKFPESPKSYVNISVCGPMVRFAADLKPMLKVLAGPNLSLLNLDKKVNLKGIKIYYVEDGLNIPIVTPLASELKVAQRKVLDHFTLKYEKTPIQMKLDGFDNSLNWFLAKLASGTDVPSFWSELSPKSDDQGLWIEMVKKLLGSSNHTFPALVYAILNASTKGDNTEAIEKLENFKKEFQDMLGADGVLIFPSHPMTAPYHYKSLFHPFNYIYTALFNALEVPSTQCPLGLGANGLPVGCQVVANKFQDHLCLSIAEEIEDAFGGWVSPAAVQGSQ